MKREEDTCLDCPSMGLPCLGTSCTQRKTITYICDGCGEEVEELYEFDGEELCETCVLERLERVK